MKRIMILLLMAVVLCGCSTLGAIEQPIEPASENGFILGADISSLIALENSGVVFRNFDGQEQDLLLTLREAGVNYIRVRVWHDPYDKAGNGYGGGNCDLDNAIEIGKRATAYNMGLFLDLHYSDFWADPGKQQVPKAWKDYTNSEKTQAVYDYTTGCLRQLRNAGVDVGMVQIGNEVNYGFCGETGESEQYLLMAAAARAVRDTDPDIRIVVHYTDPQKGEFSHYAGLLEQYGVDYDIFATSYYAYWHGSPENLTRQLRSVIDGYGKQVLIAETAWPYTASDSDGHGNSVGAWSDDMPYPFTVEGQTMAMEELMKAMASLGDSAVGIFYWEPAWIAVPGESWTERSRLWEKHGSGWASSFAGEYDPTDAGQYFGGSAWDNQALFDPDGRPLESLMEFGNLREYQN